MLISEFLSRFQGVKGHGTKYMCKCPCHQDNQASLSVDEIVGRDGRRRIAIHDHGGCAPEDILAAEDRYFRGIGAD